MTSKNVTITSIVTTVILLGGMFILLNTGAKSDPNAGTNNVSVIDGKQIIEIHAKGGYQPKTSNAKAGIPTTLRFNTSGTFDCSSAVRIPSLSINTALPPSGTTDIDIGFAQLGTLQGTCGMGMYPFEVVFQG